MSEPIPVHLTSSDVPLISPPKHDVVRTEFNRATCDDTNKIQPILPDSPQRHCAYIQVTGGDVYLCDSEAKAKSTTPQGMILPSANTAPWPLYGQNAVWAVQVTGGKTCVVSVTADYAVTS